MCLLVALLVAFSFLTHSASTISKHVSFWWPEGVFWSILELRASISGRGELQVNGERDDDCPVDVYSGTVVAIMSLRGTNLSAGNGYRRWEQSFRDSRMSGSCEPFGIASDLSLRTILDFVGWLALMAYFGDHGMPILVAHFGDPAVSHPCHGLPTFSLCSFFFFGKCLLTSELLIFLFDFVYSTGFECILLWLRLNLTIVHL